MSKNNYNLTQCTMRDQYNHIHTAWIPSKFAKVNKKIKIDEFVDSIWIVFECGETKDYEYVNSFSQAYKHTYASIDNE